MIQKIVAINVLIMLFLSGSGSFPAYAQGTASPTPIPCPASPPAGVGIATTPVTISQAGNHKVWTRMMGGGGNTSYMLQIGNTCFTVGGNASVSSTAWTWVGFRDGDINVGTVLPLSASQHIIKLIGVIPGVKLDRLLFTTNLSCVPTGETGTNCAGVTVTPPATNTPVPPTSIPSTPTPGVVTSTPPVVGILQMQVKLHGIGNGGDVVNPTSTGNINPVRTTRLVTVELFTATTNTRFGEVSGNVIYNPQSGIFSGQIPLPTNFVTNYYNLRVRSQGYLTQQILGVSLTQNQSNVVPIASLVTGDINQDATLDILDYNILVSCYGAISTTKPTTCTGTNNIQADLYDDSNVNFIDLNLWLREFSRKS